MYIKDIKFSLRKTAVDVICKVNSARELSELGEVLSEFGLIEEHASSFDCGGAGAFGEGTACSDA